MKETFNLVIQIGDARVQAYLNQPLFIQSPVFAEAASFAIEHYKAHGDRGHMVKLWLLYSGPAARRRLNERFFAEAGVRCSLVQGQVHFDAAPRSTAGAASKSADALQPSAVAEGRRATPSPAAAQGPKASLRAPPGKKSATPAAPVKKKKKKAKKIDLLDSWARVSGSYGAGKRR